MGVPRAERPGERPGKEGALVAPPASSSSAPSPNGVWLRTDVRSAPSSVRPPGREAALCRHRAGDLMALAREHGFAQEVTAPAAGRQGTVLRAPCPGFTSPRLMNRPARERGTRR